MKHLIVLPGNSPRNRAWGEACAAHFGPWFDSVYMQSYDHWETGEQWIDLAAEQAKLAEHMSAVPSDAQLFVFAKSIGSILAVNAINAGVLPATGAAFFGLPLDHAVPEVWGGDPAPLASLAVPVIAFQNDADPTAGYAYTKLTLTEHAPTVHLVTTHDDTHDYLDFPAYEADIKSFLF